MGQGVTPRKHQAAGGDSTPRSSPRACGAGSRSRPAACSFRPGSPDDDLARAATPRTLQVPDRLLRADDSPGASAAAASERRQGRGQARPIGESLAAGRHQRFGFQGWVSSLGAMTIARRRCGSNPPPFYQAGRPAARDFLSGGGQICFDAGARPRQDGGRDGKLLPFDGCQYVHEPGPRCAGKPARNGGFPSHCQRGPLIERGILCPHVSRKQVDAPGRAAATGGRVPDLVDLVWRARRERTRDKPQRT